MARRTKSYDEILKQMDSLMKDLEETKKKKLKIFSDTFSKSVDVKKLASLTDSDLKQYARKCASEFETFVPETKTVVKKEQHIVQEQPVQNSTNNDSDLSFSTGTPFENQNHNQQY